MKLHRAGRANALRLLAAATVLVGWWAALQQLLRYGWIAGNGTGWLLGFALLGTLGAAAAEWLYRLGHSATSALALLVVAASPTVFFYPLSVAVIVVALVLIGRNLAVRLVARNSATR